MRVETNKFQLLIVNCKLLIIHRVFRHIIQRIIFRFLLFWVIFKPSNKNDEYS